MNGTVAASVAAGLFAFAGILVTQLQIRSATARTARLASAKVDADAYDRARRFDAEVVASIRVELDRARGELAGLRSVLDIERREHDAANRELRRTVSRLAHQCRAAGLAVDVEGF